MGPRLVCLLACILAVPLSGRQPAPAPHRHLIIVVDGLRPDGVTADVMPNLTALGKRGVVFTRHHSVFPTVTRVNAASISTGAYPESHGLLGNSVFFPRVDPRRFLDTASRDELGRIAASEPLLTASTLGEVLQAAGQRMVAISSGSAGSAILNNHTIAGGAILHAQFAEPAAIRPAIKAAGDPPAANASPGARDRYAVDLWLKVGLPQIDPTVSVLWLGELDATAHDRGIGAPETVAVLGRVDAEIARVQDGLRSVGLFERYNIWVTSDHGFSTYRAPPNLETALRPFARTLDDGSPALVHAGGAIYLRPDDRMAPAIVAALQQTPGIGAIFTPAARPDSLDGRQPGTVSFDAVRWSHERSAQILFSPDWSDDANAYGIRGVTASSGTAGHGSASPWDVHNTLVAAGPDLRRGVILETPTANADFAPTILGLLGIPAPQSMQGRRLDEALASGTILGANAVRSFSHTSTTNDGRYLVTATFSVVATQAGTYRYFDNARVVRKP